MRRFAAVLLLVAACGGATVESTTTTEHVGREVYLRNGYCTGCHTTLGADANGPTFLGLAGSERTLTTGEVVIADDEYLRRSIIDPIAQIVEGYEDNMPDFFGRTLSDEDIANVIDYIKTLKG